MTLSPLIATIFFTLAVIAGYQYRIVWKTEGSVWKAWLFGGIAGGLLLLVALVPIRAG